MNTCVIAEDEQLLREELVKLIAEAWPGMRIAAAAEDGAEALEAIAEHQPDVAFLDIRMPGLTGIEVARAAQDSSPGTRVVFVTAYDQYAIDAFEQGAVDYLLKPVSRERLAATVKRLQSRAAADPAALSALLERLTPTGPARTPLAWLTASSGKETRLIMMEDVVYFQADNKYTVVMTADGESLIRKPIRELLAEIDPAVFKQIHRATIVNMKAIQSVVRDESGKGTIRLKRRAETLAVSLPYMPLFKNM